MLVNVFHLNEWNVSTLNSTEIEIETETPVVKRDIPEREGSLLGIIKISRRYLTLL